MSNRFPVSDEQVFKKDMKETKLIDLAGKGTALESSVVSFVAEGYKICIYNQDTGLVHTIYGEEAKKLMNTKIKTL